MQQILQLAHQRADAAGGEEILHVAGADRLQVHQHRRGVGQLVELLQRHRNAGAAGNRRQMDDGVGGAADRQQHAQRVLHRFLVDDLVGRELGADQLDRGGAGRFRRAQSVGMHGRDGGGAGQDHAERFGEASHGRGGAHHRAGAGGGGEPRFNFGDFLVVDFAGAVLRPEAAAIGAGAEPLAVIAAGHHRARHQHDRRAAGRYRAHQLRWHGLVATAHQHHRVHRLRAHHLLGVHRHQIAEFHAGRIEEHLAERDGGKLDRQRAGGKHPAFHRVEQFRKMAVAIVEAGRGIGDADHRLFQHGAGIAHRQRKGAPQITREIAVAVIGEAERDADGFFAHAELFCRVVRPDASRLAKGWPAKRCAMAG